MSGSAFRALLQQTTDTVERPKAVADGHYIGEIRNFEFGTSRQKQTPFLRLYLVPLEETEDCQGANGDMDLSKRELRKEFYITPASLYRLSDMLDAVLGQETGRSFDDRIPELRGVRVLFAVTHRDATDGSPDVYNDVGTIVAAESE